MPAKRLLLLEDEPSLSFVLGKFFTGKGYLVDKVATIAAAKNLLKANSYFLHMLDVRLPDGDGIDLLGWAKLQGISTPFIVMTAEGTMQNGIRAVKKGAFEYLVKPFDLDELSAILDRIEGIKKLIKTSGAEPQPASETAEYELIGNSPPMQKLFKKIGKAAASDFTVLITGESGSGKELVARNLHQFSDRCNQPFLSMNCAAIPKDLVESELFGHTKGAFTSANSSQKGILEESSGGTLFMDELGELPLPIQSKLLRFLEDGRVTPVGSRKEILVNVRFIAATNQNIKKMVSQGSFREDLYHRLNVISITVPPLRERRQDIITLTKYFMKKYSNGKQISEDALQLLSSMNWQGNVRQLQNLIKRTSVMTSDELLLPQHFNTADNENSNEIENWISGMLSRLLQTSAGEIYEKIISPVEQELIRQTLEKTDGNKLAAAKLLGINRNTLAAKISKKK